MFILYVFMQESMAYILHLTAVNSRRGGGPARGPGGWRARRLPCGGAAGAHVGGSAPHPSRDHPLIGEAV